MADERLDPEIGGHLFHTQDGTQVHDGAAADCPRCTPPGSAAPDVPGRPPSSMERQREAAASNQPHLNSDGEPCDCGQTPPQPGLTHYLPKPVKLIGPDDRDRLAAEDQGQYYCVGANHGVLVAREGRPLYATLAEWQSIAAAVPGSVYIPITRQAGARKLGPLFGSRPMFDMEGAPDIVGRVVEVLTFLERAAEMTAQRVSTLDEVVQRVAGRPTHERELLRRAAAIIDADTAEGVTYEQRLDWLAKYREVTS